MADQRWLDGLQRELRQRGLPETYSARLIEELIDHFTDIKKEDPSMEAQASAENVIGAPDVLAAAAESGYVGRSFAGRHPIWAFLVWPVPAALVAVIAVACLIVLPSEWLIALSRTNSAGSMGTGSPTVLEWTVAYFNLCILRFVPFGVTALFFIRMSRHAKNPWWGSAACGCVAGLAFLFRAIIEPPTDQYALMLRVGLGYEHGLYQWQNGLLQMAVPLLLGLWAWRRRGSFGSPCAPAPLPG